MQCCHGWQKHCNHIFIILLPKSYLSLIAQVKSLTSYCTFISCCSVFNDHCVFLATVVRPPLRRLLIISLPMVPVNNEFKIRSFFFYLLLIYQICKS